MIVCIKERPFRRHLLLFPIGRFGIRLFSPLVSPLPLRETMSRRRPFQLSVLFLVWRFPLACASSPMAHHGRVQESACVVLFAPLLIPLPFSFILAFPFSLVRPWVIFPASIRLFDRGGLGSMESCMSLFPLHLSICSSCWCILYLHHCRLVAYSLIDRCSSRLSLFPASLVARALLVPEILF